MQRTLFDRSLARRLKPPAQIVTLAVRTALLRSLDAATAGRLIILVAPPGYGKTTTLAQWWNRQRESNAIAAWYAASAEDNSALAFLLAVGQSLDQAGVEFGSESFSALDGVDAKQLLAIILQAVEQCGTPAVLIIDEFERVDRPEIVDIVETLILEAPANFSVAIASRRKPSLAVSQLRVQGMVRVIDVLELRLDRTEIAAVLNMDMQAPELDRAVTITEGWPIAVQLYRLLQERTPLPDLVHFNGTLDDIAGYLTEQVLASVPTEHRDLIFDLSLFEFVEAALLDAARERSDSARLLDELHASLPGLVQQVNVDDVASYRLHPLIADFGRSRLAFDKVRAQQLETRAIEWLWVNHRYATAIRRCVNAGSSDALVAKLSSFAFLPVFLAAGANALRSILREIPRPIVDTMPRLRLMAALAHFKTGLFDEATEMLDKISDQTGGFRKDPFGNDRDLQIEGLALALFFSVNVRGPSADCGSQIATLLAISGKQPLISAWCENVMIAVHQERGDLIEARQSVARTHDIYRANGVLPFSELYIQTHEMLIGLAEGSLKKVGEIIGGRSIRRTDGAADPPLSAMAKLASAIIDYERNYNERAADTIQIALEQFGEGEAWFDQYALAYPVLADVAWRRRGLDGVLTLLDQVEARLRKRGMTGLDSYARTIEMHYRLRAGQSGVARSTPRSLSWRERDLQFHNEILELMTFQKFDQAAVIAENWFDQANDGGRAIAKARAETLRATALDQSGRHDEATLVLCGAIRLTFPEQVISCFIQEAAMVRPLLMRAQSAEASTMEQRHMDRILAVLNEQSPSDNARLLTEKEARIMAYVADGASNKLIARQLGVSDNAIKFHLKKVYLKLGVSSRKAAAAVALSSGLPIYPN